jgi:putative chitinase
MTIDQLTACLPYAKKSDIQRFFTPLQEAMKLFNINTPKRQAAFIAQIAHESGSFRYMEELASGEDYDTGSKAISLGNTPEKDGDGQRFKGRGLIQITGKSNYKAVSKALKYDFIKSPEKLEEPGPASYSAAWFWESRGLNELADQGQFKRITKKINGGYNGFKDRVEHYHRCQKALGLTEINFIESL